LKRFSTLKILYLRCISFFVICFHIYNKIEPDVFSLTISFDIFSSVLLNITLYLILDVPYLQHRSSSLLQNLRANTVCRFGETCLRRPYHIRRHCIPVASSHSAVDVDRPASSTATNQPPNPRQAMAFRPRSRYVLLDSIYRSLLDLKRR
jgi:hypothetical protein